MRNPSISIPLFLLDESNLKKHSGIYVLGFLPPAPWPSR
jgi:hypothetical protein